MRDRTFIPTEELNQHDYRFVVRRNSPEPTGWLGTFYGEDLEVCDGFLEEAVRNFFGGGRYSVKVYKDSIPQPGVVRVNIAGTPKKQRSRKERKESQVEKLKEEIKKLKEEIKKESEQKVDELKDEPSKSALEEIFLAFSEAFTEEDETVDFMEELFSKLKSLAVDIIKEVKTEKESESETVAEIKDATAENQSQIEDINLHLLRQDAKIDQVRKLVNSINREMKMKEFEQRERFMEAQRERPSIDPLLWLGGAGVALYKFSPKFKEFVDGLIGRKDKANPTNISSQRRTQQVDASRLPRILKQRAENQFNSSEVFQGRVFPQLQDTILGDFPKSII